MWTQDPKNFDKDLQSGVVHYPGTAMPNQVGTTYISGHSSNYAWAKGNFNQVFSKLGDLADNTSIKITVVQKNGRDARLHYVVTHRKEFKATDQEQFLNAGKPVVALSTCWPVGSTAKRLVVFAELTQVERD
jgi:LPXTG-site transpeptidase (sortase) family protein